MSKVFSRWFSISIVAVGCAVFFLPNIVLAESEGIGAMPGGEGPGLGAVFGQLEYRLSCASCHGPEGKGDGPVADALKTQPTNLQMISKNNDGKFPADELYKIIDGRQTIRAHGTSDMPVWGSDYTEFMQGTRRQDVQPDEIKAAVHGRILSLVYYIQSIQVE